MNTETHIWSATPSQVINTTTYIICGLLSLTGLLALISIPFAIWKYMEVKCKTYTLTSQRLRVESGIFSKKCDSLELYRVKDTKFDQPFLLRLFGMGNVSLISSDSTTPITTIIAIKDAHLLQEQIRSLVEERRDQKRVRITELE